MMQFLLGLLVAFGLTRCYLAWERKRQRARRRAEMQDLIRVTEQITQVLGAPCVCRGKAEP
jgi:hypothetical protein